MIALVIAIVAIGAGLLLGHSGFDVIRIPSVQRVLPLVVLQISIVLALLGLQLGRGLLRCNPLEILRRSLPPLAFAAVALIAGVALLPRLLAPLERPFDTFHLPLAFVLAALSLLALRDVRGRPPADVGSIFLVAIGLVGAAHSFAPVFVWANRIDPGFLWRGPVLVLGESGALGFVGAVVWLALVRRARLPALVVGTIAFAGVLWLAFDWRLWPPFAALGFGIALGRAGVDRLPVLFAGSRAVGSELPLLLIAGLVFAPDLWRESLILPSLAWAVALAILALGARLRLAGGRQLVTGPGLLFLGLAVAVRLDPRMGPLGRVTIDLALPAWVVGRFALELAQSRATTKIKSSDVSE